MRNILNSDLRATFIYDYPLHEVEVPGVVISSKDASKVIHYATTSQNPIASITFGQTFTGWKPAPTVTVSFAKGPSSSFPSILKPDAMAPGSLVLASWIPDLRAAQTGRSTFAYNDFNMLYGTSAACSHTSGVPALLKSSHLECSPAAIRSALVTTANPLDNSLNPIQNGDRDVFASPLDMGAGQIDPNRALEPGLVYDPNPQDYVSFMCSMNFTKKQILAITSSNCYTCSNDSFHDLNYPSFIGFYNGDVKLMKRTYQRVLTDVGKGLVTYKVNVTAPYGSRVEVLPTKLYFRKKYEKQSYTMIMSYKGSKDRKVSHGELVWVEENAYRTVRSPIVVSKMLTVLSFMYFPFLFFFLII